jgi:hypothetical protein
MKRRSVSSRLQLIERQDKVGEILHESARDVRNRRATDSRWSVVHAERTVLGGKYDYAFRIPAAPGLPVAFREIGQLLVTDHISLVTVLPVRLGLTWVLRAKRLLSAPAEFQISAPHFHFASVCFSQTVRYFPVIGHWFAAGVDQDWL